MNLTELEKNIQMASIYRALLMFAGNKSYYLYGASSNDFRDFLPNHHMQFEMMKYAREHGATTYDFGGTDNNPDKDSEHYGLWAFKRVWGTYLSEKIGEFDYVLNQPLYQLIEQVKPRLTKAKIKLSRKLKGNMQQKSERFCDSTRSFRFLLNIIFNIEGNTRMIKKLLQFSLGNKFAIFLMVVLVILGGIYSSAKLKLELLPDVENPMISVQTTMPGATPQSTEDEISRKIDNQVRSLAYVKSVKTESIQNASIVTVEYNDGTDMDKAEEQLKRN